MPLETPARIVSELATRGYNAEREAVTLLADAPDTDAALDRALETLPDDALKLRARHVRDTLETDSSRRSLGDRSLSDPAESPSNSPESPAETTDGDSAETSARSNAPADSDSSVSTATKSPPSSNDSTSSPVETKGVSGDGIASEQQVTREIDPEQLSVEIDGDMTGQSTGTGEYSDFVAVFRDRYERLSKQLRGRVNHRPTDALESLPGNEEAAVVGMVSDIRSTASGHWLVELEDTNGTFPTLVMKDRPIADLVGELLLDEVIAVEGTLADDGGILFVDSLHFPDIPRTYEPSTADRPVKAALISDVHVGSQEFKADAWHRFADWLHTDDAEGVEYLLIAGDMVEGVGVYPDQDEELDVIDVYDQYERFSEYLKEVPGDMEIVMIPGNHDAVRLAEPQPAFDSELRQTMSAHDARFTSNPSLVTIEGVSVLMYHGVSLDEVIAELPDEKASYDEPQKAMYQLLKKRHVAPQYGGHTRLAPETRDYLIIDEVPDVFHAGHVHKLGYGKYHNVLTINSGCWQAQTDFQKSVNIDPDAGFAPIVDLETLELTVRSFG
ncbi:DNA-directed DNA polymerase II small subunit [Halapricum desulfuricans]|uniref:DNA-directed DNA polymerase II small subunit n=1 Tax=Halapricum desulfuricans TaxID=2841257 RepID=UPI001E5E153E|nr:DNA-directed DNA polymerase II small subunit [Halapricum desulfuricans]